MAITAQDIISLAQNTKALSEEQIGLIMAIAPDLGEEQLLVLKEKLEKIQEEELKVMKERVEILQEAASKQEEYMADKARTKREGAESSSREGELAEAESLIKTI